jgi:hypothetical protein
VEDNKDLADGIAELLRLHGVIVRVAYGGPLQSRVLCARFQTLFYVT